jgi:CheY-like chemotaxis protein
MKLERSNLRLVLVDDDAKDCELLQTALAEKGFSHPLTYFNNGEAALNYFKGTRTIGATAPHIILLDINMPLINGVDALHSLRETSSFRDLPVIILTGIDAAAKRRELAHLGIFRFLRKQADSANVVAALDDFIGLYNHVNLPPAA